MLLFKLYDCISVLTTDDSIHWLKSFAGHRTCGPQTLIKKKENWQKLTNYQLNLSFKIWNSDGWQIEKKNDAGIFYSKNVPSVGKVFKFEGVINCRIEDIKERVFDKTESNPEWNLNVQSVKIIKKIEERLMITHSITKRFHTVSNREFIHLASWGHINNYMFIQSFSIDYPEVPENSHAVRGEHKIFTYFIRPLQNDPSKTHMVWLMHMNLKGWLPQAIVDSSSYLGMVDHVNHLKAVVEK